MTAIPSRRAVAYLRVSTEQQTTENQRAELQQLAGARGLELGKVYEETASAVASRPVLEQLMRDASAGKFGVLLVWSLDRLERSMTGTIARVLELERLGVHVISLRESWLDTTGPTRQLLLAIFGWVAEFERTRLVERTKAGLARARGEGKRLGRPPVSPVMLGAAADRVEAGNASVRAAAAAAGLPKSAVHREVHRRGELARASRKGPPPEPPRGPGTTGG